MKYSFYVIDDLRLGYAPMGVKGWRYCSFLDQKQALDYYRQLPKSVVKELGLTDGETFTGLMRCVPLFSYDTVGEDVLLTDAYKSGKWGEREMLIEIGQKLVSSQDIRFCLDEEQLIPSPKPIPTKLNDKYLWGDKPGDHKSAIKWIYVGGVGWIAPSEFQRRYPANSRSYHYPMVLQYRVDAVNANGHYESLEVTPWEYRHLEQQTQKRVRINKNNKGGIRT